MLHNLLRSTTLAAGAVIILSGLLGPSARAAVEFPAPRSPTEQDLGLSTATLTTAPTLTVVTAAQSTEAQACSVALDNLGQA